MARPGPHLRRRRPALATGGAGAPPPRPRVPARARGAPSLGIGPGPRRDPRLQLPGVDRADVRRVEGARRLLERQLPLQGRGDGPPPGHRGGARDRLPRGVRPARRRGAAGPSAPPPPDPAPRRLRERAPAGRDRLGGLARGGERRAPRPALHARRPLHHLHRRHDRDAEGRPLAPRGRLLQRPRRPHPGLRAPRGSSCYRPSCTGQASGLRSTPSIAAAP